MCICVGVKSPGYVGLVDGWVHIHSCYFCQLGRVNNRTSAVRSIASRETIIQFQVMTHSRRRGAFLLQWCMAHAFSWYSIRKLHQGPGGGETEETTCLYHPLASTERSRAVSLFERSSNQALFWKKAFVFFVWGHPMKSFHHVWLTWRWGCCEGNLELYMANRP